MLAMDPSSLISKVVLLPICFLGAMAETPGKALIHERRLGQHREDASTVEKRLGQYLLANYPNGLPIRPKTIHHSRRATVRQQIGYEPDPMAINAFLATMGCLLPFVTHDAVTKREKRDAAIEKVRKESAKLMFGSTTIEDLQRTKLEAIKAQREYAKSRNLGIGSYSFDFASTQLQAPELSPDKIEALLMNQTEFNQFMEVQRPAVETFQPQDVNDYDVPLTAGDMAQAYVVAVGLVIGFFLFLESQGVQVY